jgi:hypothetical protein
VWAKAAQEVIIIIHAHVHWHFRYLPGGDDGGGGGPGSGTSCVDECAGPFGLVYGSVMVLVLETEPEPLLPLLNE